MVKKRKASKQWIPVEDGETVAACYERLQNSGYVVVGRREEPQFIEVDGKRVWHRQQIEFQVIRPSS